MNLKELEEVQRRIAERVRIEEAGEVSYVAGVDQAFFKHGNVEYVVSSAVLMSYPDLKLIDSSSLVEEVEFPYIPTFLMFRESKPALKVLRKILREKTVIMVDGSGLAHPRKCGIATYIGVKLENPSIGITKKKLFGEIRGEEEPKKLFVDGMHVGYQLKTCRRCNPIFVSVGNLITPEESLEIVKNCLRGYRLPEPVRIADRLSKEKKSEYLSDFNSALQGHLG